MADAISAPENARVYVPLASKPRPWFRYFARIVDIWVWAITIGFVLGMIAPSVVEGVHDTVFGLIIMLLAIPLQAMVMAVFGNTLGKFLLGIKVTKNGRLLSFNEAIKREFLVYIRGLALGLPLVSLVTLLVGYNNLSKKGITSWDEENSFVVTHKNPSTGGIIGVIAIAFVVAIFFFIGLSAG